MSGPLLPSDILTEVILNLVATKCKMKQWLSLRLVNRFFYDELLVATFVRRKGQIEGVHSDSYPTGKLQRLINAWSLAGALIRPWSHAKLQTNRMKFMDAIHLASGRLAELADRQSVDLPASQTTRGFAILSSIPTGPHSTSPRIAQLVCDALISTISTKIIRWTDSIFRLVQPLEVFNFTASEMVYLTTCLIGHVSLLQMALAHMNEDLPQGADSATTLAGMRVAARQGKYEILKYLLDVGNDSNGTGGVHHDGILSAAAESGNICLLQLLLRPEYKVDLARDWNGDAVVTAAEVPDPVTRKELVKLLWSSLKIREENYARAQVLRHAARLNDLEIAEFILADGPADLYSEWFHRPSSTHPVLLAVDHESPSVLRAILEAPFVQIVNYKFYQLVCERALEIAKAKNHLPIFLTLIPHLKWLSTTDILIWAAQIDCGLCAVEEKTGALDLKVEFTPKTKHNVPEYLLGPQLLNYAVKTLRTQNANWLLARGVRTQNPIQVWNFYYRARPDEYNQMAELLVSHQNPGITVGCENPPDWTWCSEISLSSAHHSLQEPQLITYGEGKSLDEDVEC